jgi:hypothetical protein
VSDKEIQNLLIDLKDVGGYNSLVNAIDGISTILSIYYDRFRISMCNTS